MILLNQGTPKDAKSLANLVLSSAPLLLPYLFGSAEQTIHFIERAGARADGQYSASRHHLAFDNDTAVGSITLWSNDLPASFHQHTLKCLSDFLDADQIAHLVSTNDYIAKVFAPPTNEQLCIGHLAVLEDYQGMGIGKKLIAHSLQVAKRLDKAQVVLDVDATNEQALSFYLGNGFNIYAKTNFSPTKQQFLRMHYSLS